MKDLAEIKELHHPHHLKDVCYTCRQEWPCDTALTLAEIDRQEALVAEAERRRYHIVQLARQARAAHQDSGDSQAALYIVYELANGGAALETKP